MRRPWILAALALAGTGGALLTEQGWLAAKAAVARVLIDRALVAHLRDGRTHLPWSWADVYPIGRIEVPRLGLHRVVLSGATGASLAFGAGHVDGTAAPNHPGNCAVAGHRDGAFAFLRDLRVGDTVILRARGGADRYVVQDRFVTGRFDEEPLDTGRTRQLTLITCYPFGGLTRSDLRFVVVCRPADGVAAETSARNVLASEPTTDGGARCPARRTRI